MTEPRPGWFGLASHVTFTLGVLGADTDEEGRFKVAGTLAAGIGGDEIVIGPDAVYFIDGEPRSLASAMNGTSYGVRGITVI